MPLRGLPPREFYNVSIQLPELTAEAVAALQNGQKIEAIKIMHERFGLTLLEAKQVVEQYEYRLIPQQVAQDMPSYALPAEVINELRQGNKLAAIKRLRQLRHIDLASAKHTIDTYLQLNPQATPTNQGIQSKAVSSMKWIVLLLFIFTVVAGLIISRAIGGQ